METLISNFSGQVVTVFYLNWLTISNILFIFADRNSNKYDIMCTVTLEYNQHNALARRKLAALLATGLFVQKDVSPDKDVEKNVEAHRTERAAFLAHSKQSMSKIIARYL